MRKETFECHTIKIKEKIVKTSTQVYSISDWLYKYSKTVAKYRGNDANIWVTVLLLNRLNGCGLWGQRNQITQQSIC